MTEEVFLKAHAEWSKKDEEANVLRKKDWQDGKRLVTPQPQPTLRTVLLYTLRELLKTSEGSEGDKSSSYTHEHRLAAHLGHAFKTQRTKSGVLEEKVPPSFNTHLLLIENPR